MKFFRYTTVDSLEEYLSLETPSASETRRELGRFIGRASAAIDSFTKRKFAPTRKTIAKDHVSNTQIRFWEDILAVKGLSDYNGASEFGSEVWHLRQGRMYDLQPYDNLIVDDTNGSLLNFTDTRIRAIRIDAIVGYNEDYGTAWELTGASVASDLGAGDSVVNTGASAEYDEVNLRSRYMAGELLMIGDEFIHVVSGSGASALRVERGVNGTTAASHASGISVYRWVPEHDISYATTALAAWQYAKKDSPYTNQLASLQFGTIETPEKWPPEVLEKIRAYKKKTVVSI